MPNLVEEYVGLHSSSEHPWAIRFLGKNISNDSASIHSLLRKIVFTYLLTTAFWINIVMKLCALCTLIKPDKVGFFLIVFVAFSFSIEISYGRTTVYSAATIWAKFQNKIDIKLEEITIIIDRFSPFLWMRSILSIIHFALSILSIVQIYKFMHWSIILNVILTLTIFYISTQILNIIPGIIFFLHVKSFQEKLAFTKEYLLEDYELNWENDSEKNDDLTIQFSTINLISLVFILSLLYVELFLKPTLIFNIFFAAIILALLLQSIYSTSTRLKSPENFFRKPLLPLGSKILSFHLFHSMILEAFWVFSSMSVISSFVKKDPTWIFLLLSPFIVFSARYILGNSTIKIFKKILNQEFKILIFRRFSADFSEINKKLIYPTLGAYGNLLSINDKYLFEAKSGTNPDSEQILNEYRTLLYSTEKSWQKHVAFYLLHADLVIFQWNDLPTKNMEWEFLVTLSQMPEHRIIFICDQNNLSQIQCYVQNILKQKASSIKFISISNDTTSKLFVNEIHNIFKLLKKEAKTNTKII
ncbi:hypothetical protein [Haliscomenobacter sp.]|uniref:hypothetical protein n=1 Tax=Haliscomenobacter sp. TaxID=2717303 RepID=UPI003BAD1694